MLWQTFKKCHSIICTLRDHCALRIIHFNRYNWLTIRFDDHPKCTVFPARTVIAWKWFVSQLLTSLLRRHHLLNLSHSACRFLPTSCSASLWAIFYPKKRVVLWIKKVLMAKDPYVTAALHIRCQPFLEFWRVFTSFFSCLQQYINVENMNELRQSLQSWQTNPPRNAHRRLPISDEDISVQP